jgi:phage baseplate assembly protein gpV
MDRLLGALKQHVAAMIARIGQPRWGTVTSYDATNHLAKVLIQPEGNQTGWLPIGCPWVGPGWGEITPLHVGQQVKMVPDSGDPNNLVIVTGGYSTSMMPPIPSNVIAGAAAAMQPGERAFVSMAGSVIRFCADGSIYGKGTFFNWEGNMVVSKNLEVLGDLAILGTAIGATGAITAKGEISDLAGARGTLDLLRSDHDLHMHGNVTTGSGFTGLPTLETP